MCSLWEVAVTNVWKIFLSYLYYEECRIYGGEIYIVLWPRKSTV